MENAMITKNKTKHQFHMEQIAQLAVELFLFVILAFLFLKGFTQVETSGKYAALAVLGSLLFLLFFFYGTGCLFKSLSEAVLKKIFVIQCVVALLVQLFFLFYYRSMYLWDGAFVLGGANSLLNEGAVAGEAYYYLSVYPNQNGFVLLSMAILKMGQLLGLEEGNRILLLNTINTVAIDVSLIFTILLVKKLKPALSQYQWNKLACFLFANPFLYVTVSYYYTMTLSLPWFMGFVYFFAALVKEKEDLQKKQIFRAIAAGICVSIGYYLRATTIIPLIGAGITGILLVWANRKKVSKGKLLTCMGNGMITALTALVLTVFLTGFGAKIVGIDTTDTAFPTTHWLMMSLSGEGFHNGEDEAYTASFLTKEEKKQAVMERLKERLSDMGVTGYIRQAEKKLGHTFSGGANSYKMFYENALNTDKGYSYFLGEKSQGFLFYAQAYHMFTLLFIIFAFRKKFSWDLFFLEIMLLGGFLFYVLWEAAAQYQIPFLMVMSVLAAEGAECGNQLVKSKSLWKKAPYLGLAGIGFICLFLVLNYNQFVKTEETNSHPVVTQTLANEPVLINQSFIQTFETDQSFNYILFQWRNPVGEENNSVYKITLTGEKTGLVFSELLNSKGTAYQGGFEKEFPMTEPKKREVFTLKIEKIQGTEEEYLEFVTYKMGGYDSYPYGETSLEEGRDLTFLVSKKQVTTLSSNKKYVFFVTALFLLFLFLTFCCKIEGNVKRKDLSYGS